MLLWIWIYECLLKSWLFILLSIYPEVEFLDHRLILFLIFLGTMWHFPELPHHFQFLPTGYRGSSFFISSPTLVFYFDSSHPNSYEVTCISLIISHVEYLFMHLLALYNFFGEISVQVFAHFLFSLFDFFVVFDQFFSIYIYSGSESLYQIDFQFVGFYSINSVFSCSFQFSWSLSVFLLYSVLLVQCPRNHCQIQCCGAFAFYFLVRLL